MLKVSVNENTTFEVERLKGSFLLNGKVKTLKIMEADNGQLQVINGNRIYSVEVISLEEPKNTMTLRVNGNDYEVLIKDRLLETRHTTCAISFYDGNW